MKTVQGDDWGVVDIHRDDNGLVAITVDGRQVPAVQTGSIRAIGGTLRLDVTDVTAIPDAELDDAFLAQAWLEPVYGTEVADVVALFEDDAYAESHRVNAVRGELSAIVARLGEGYWLHRWWPSGSNALPDVDVRLLDIEIGSLAWLAEALFVDPAPIQRLLQPHTETLVQVVGELRSASGAVAETHLGILTTALRASVDLVDSEAPGYPEVVALLGSIEAENAVVAAAFDSVNWDALSAELADSLVGVARRLPVRELVRTRAGSSSLTPLVRSGTAEADWAQLSPRTAVARHGNVTWLIHDERGTIWLTVRLDASAQADTAAHVMARVYPADNLRAFPMIFALDYDPTQHAFVGRRELDVLPETDLIIDVFDALFASRPRLSDSAQAAAVQDRQQIVAILTERSASLDSGGFIAERTAWETRR